MKNLSVPEDLGWGKTETKEIAKAAVIVEEVYAGADFKLGDNVKSTVPVGWTNGEKIVGLEGVIFKALSNHNYWVAFPEMENRLGHLPCHFDVMNRKQLELIGEAQ